MNKKRILFALVASGLSVFGLLALKAEPEPKSANTTSMDGDWVGRLSEAIANLKVVIHIKTLPTGVAEATMDSPDQGGYGVPVSAISIKDNNLSFEIKTLDVIYNGKLNPEKNAISGNFVQHGITSELTFQSLASAMAKIPTELNFKYGRTIPNDFRPSLEKEECKITLKNKTADYICLGVINSDGNLQYGWADGNAGMPVFYVSPNSQTNAQRPYSPSVGSAFVILTISGKVIGYGKPSKAGNYELVIE
jgi:hypothetical protein